SSDVCSSDLCTIHYAFYINHKAVDTLLRSPCNEQQLLVKQLPLHSTFPIARDASLQKVVNYCLLEKHFPGHRQAFEAQGFCWTAFSCSFLGCPPSFLSSLLLPIPKPSSLSTTNLHE